MIYSLHLTGVASGMPDDAMPDGGPQAQAMAAPRRQGSGATLAA